MSNVTKWPISTWKRIKNRRGQRVVNCQVSERYITFERASDSGTKEGVMALVNVMTDRSFDEKADRKLCELVLTLDELKAMVATMEKDLIP